MIIQDFETSLISETRSMNRTAMKGRNFIAVGFNRRGENAMKKNISLPSVSTDGWRMQ